MSAPFGPIIIRTSDRVTFKRCRRAWKWSSHLHGNLEPKITADPLWLGTGVHFALEDFHGHNWFTKPSAALLAFASAWRLSKLPLPAEWEDNLALGIAIMDYYSNTWLARCCRDSLQTYWVDNVPQVEVTARVKLPILGPNGEDVYYQVTFDRIVEVDGYLWVVEYKTAASFREGNYQTDQQTTSYCWLGQVVYDRPVKGVFYQQHRKTLPQAPAFSPYKRRFSTAEKQITSAPLYRDALVTLYGTLNKVPADNIEYLNELQSKETELRDAFVIRERVTRNESELEHEGSSILLEVADMIDPNLRIYRNATQWCNMCSFLYPCIMHDDGSDWEHQLQTLYTTRQEEQSEWRKHLKWP